MEAQDCNPNYSGGRDRRIMLWLTWAKHKILYEK
jgi:hypothetical protein